jgi:hypothetical protein
MLIVLLTPKPAPGLVQFGKQTNVAIRRHWVAQLPHFTTAYRKLSLMNSISSTEEAGLPRATR